MPHCELGVRFDLLNDIDGDDTADLAVLLLSTRDVESLNALSGYTPTLAVISLAKSKTLGVYGLELGDFGQAASPELKIVPDCDKDGRLDVMVTTQLYLREFKELGACQFYSAATGTLLAGFTGADESKRVKYSFGVAGSDHNVRVAVGLGKGVLILELADE